MINEYVCKKCEDCKSESDGVPDCIIDGCCPYDIQENEARGA